MNLKHFVLLLALFSVPEIKISAQVQQTSVGSPTRAESFARIREFVQTKKYSSAIALGNAVGFTEHPSATSIEEFEVVEALCEAYLRIGNLTQALPLFNEAYAYRLKSLGAKHSKTILSLTRLANVYLDHGDAAKALLLNQQALQLQEQEHPTEHQNVMVILSNLAMAYIQLGKCAIALPLNLKASNLRNSYDSSMNPLVSHEDQDYFQGENNLALNYQCLGNYEAALQLSRGGFRSSFVLGTDNPDYLRNQDLLASIDEVLGNCDAAHYKNYFNLKTRKYIYGIEHPDTLGNISNLASNYLCLGDYAEALPLNQMALQLREEVRGPEHPETLQSLNNLAINYRALGEHAKALPLNQMALQLREKVRGPEHPETLQSLNNLASNYRDLGQYDTAISLALRAVHLGELILGSKHPDLGEYWRNLGFFLSEYKAVDPAILSFKTSVNIYQSIREQVSRIDRYSVARILFKDTYTPKIENTYQQLAILLTDAGRLAEAQSVLDMLAETEQFDFIRRSGDADPRHTRIDFSSFERAWFDRYQQISGRLATLGSEKRELEAQSKSDLSRQQTIRLKQLKADIAVAESAFNQFVNQIRANFAAQGPSRSTEVAETSLSANRELQTLVKELGKDVALLRYYVTNDKVGMLLTTPDIQIARNVNVDSKEINRLVATARRALRDPKSKPLEALQALYKVLFAPVEQDLAQAGISTIMLAPDGVLRYLPFGALHDGKHYAAERWRLPLYTSVVRDKLRDTPKLQWQAAGLGVSRKIGDFDALPSVRSELGSIVRSGTSSGVLNGEVYLDDAFTAERLRTMGQRNFELMHVASHFRFSPGTEINSFLLLGDGQHLSLGDIRTKNYRFDNVDLLTLSACDTGLGGGRDEKGVEIQGFGVIAQQQGAKAVLATLWPVADKSTASLMADMYRRRQLQGLSKIEALRQAQLALMQQPSYAHPFYWAPFILMGNWK